MEAQKPRRRDKWFSKVLGREAPPQVSPSKATAPQDDEPQGGDGSSRKVNTKPPPAQIVPESIDAKATLPLYQASITANNAKLETSPDEAASDLKEPVESASINGKSPPGSMVASKPHGADDLSAPVFMTSKIAKSTSPYRKEEAVVLPRLLDPTTSMQSADLWEKAYTQLSQDPKHKDLLVKYEAILEESSLPAASSESFPEKMEASVQRKVDVMKKKQWTLQWDQKPIVIREQAERIVKFIQTFSSLGTAIAQIDPVHIGIPWAGVCAVLTLILNDSTQHKAALDGLEEVSSIVAKYIAIEDLYVRSRQADPNSSSSAAFQKSIIKVYSGVLQFQVQAALHFHRPTMARTVSNLVKSVDWTDKLSKIKQSDAECVAMTSVTAMSNMSSGIGAISSGMAELRKRSEEIHEMSRIFGTLQEYRDEKQKKYAVVIAWISDAQVGEDHERVRAKLGGRHWDAGQWFLRNPNFIEWKSSPRGQFWLQGSVGTGKTSLASIVINELVKAGDDRSIAFYYCSRSSTGSSNEPTAIFRSLVAQLACTSDGEEMYPVITEWHNKDAKRFVMGSQLSLTECEDLLVTLMTLRGSTVIVIDGVDECTEEITTEVSVPDMGKIS